MFLYRRFVAGNAPEALGRAAREVRRAGWDPVWTPTRERVRSEAVVDAVRRAFDADPPRALALKLSVVTYPELVRLFEWSGPRTSEVWIDAEDVDRYLPDLKRAYALQRRLRDARGANPNVQLVPTVQTVRRDAPAVLDALLERSARDEVELAVKLVRGAYRRRADTHWIHKADTDRCFDECAARLIDADRRARNVHVVFATHNRPSIDAIVRRIARVPDRRFSASIAQLRGFERTDWVDAAHKAGIRTQLLLPFGSFFDSIPYMIRRARENPSMWPHLFRPFTRERPGAPRTGGDTDRGAC